MIPNKQVIGLYALENTDQTIYLDLKNRPFVPLSFLDKKNKTFPVRDIRITEKNNQHVLSISFKRWSYCFLMTDSFTQFPFQADISKNDDAIALSWSNPTPHRITNSYIYLNGHMFYIGDMDASQKGITNILMSKMISVEQFQKQMEESLSHKASTPLPDLVFGSMKKSILDNVINHIRGSHQAKGHTLYLLGWVDPPVVPYSFQAPDSFTAALTLLMWEMPVGGTSDFY